MYICIYTNIYKKVHNTRNYS